MIIRARLVSLTMLLSTATLAEPMLFDEYWHRHQLEQAQKSVVVRTSSNQSTTSQIQPVSPLHKKFSTVMSQTFGCPEFFFRAWEQTRDLIQADAQGQNRIEVLPLIRAELENTFYPGDNSETIKLARSNLLDLFNIAYFHGESFYRHYGASRSQGAYSEAIVINAPELYDQERAFRKSLQSTIFRLNVLGTQVNVSCDEKGYRTTAAPTPSPVRNVVITVERPTLTYTQVPTNTVVHTSATTSLSPASIAAVAVSHSTSAPVPAPASTTSNTSAKTVVVTESKQTVPVKKTTPPDPNIIPAAEAFRDTVDFLDYVYQEESCREKLPRATRRLVFLAFDRHIRKKKGDVSSDDIYRFAKRAAMINSESSGGYSTRVFAEGYVNGKRKHTPDSYLKNPDLAALSILAKINPKEYKQYYERKKIEWARLLSSEFEAKSERWTDREGDKHTTKKLPAARISTLENYLNARVGHVKFGIPWVKSTNFGILQMSSDRMNMPGDGERVRTIVSRLKKYIQENNWGPLFNYCRSPDFFVDSRSNIAKEFRVIKNCDMEPTARKTIEAQRPRGVSYEDHMSNYSFSGNMGYSNSDISCFGSWMMLCPGLNFEIGVNTLSAYFGKDSQEQTPVCMESFKDMLRKYKLNN